MVVNLPGRGCRCILSPRIIWKMVMEVIQVIQGSQFKNCRDWLSLRVTKSKKKKNNGTSIPTNSLDGWHKESSERYLTPVSYCISSAPVYLNLHFSFGQCEFFAFLLLSSCVLVMVFCISSPSCCSSFILFVNLVKCCLPEYLSW